MTEPQPPSPRILIADDTSFMLRLLEATFKKGGYQCLLCRTGEEALRVATHEKPDLIVMDVMMPGMDGLEAVRKLKADERTGGIPVIVLTAKGHALTEAAAREAGAALFLTKPFSPTQMLVETKRLLSES